MGFRWGMARLGSGTWPEHLNSAHHCKNLWLKDLLLIHAPFHPDPGTKLGGAPPRTFRCKTGPRKGWLWLRRFASPGSIAWGWCSCVGVSVGFPNMKRSSSRPRGRSTCSSNSDSGGERVNERSGLPPIRVHTPGEFLDL